MSDQIREHPLLAKLGAAGAANVTSFKGYVGPSTTDAYLRLYTSLDDLSESVEIARNDVIYSASAPETVLPFGGTIIWVKKDADVTFHRSEKSAASARAQNVLEVNRGRLQIVVRGGGRASQVCQSRCTVCQSRCGVCHSGGVVLLANPGEVNPQTRR